MRNLILNIVIFSLLPFFSYGQTYEANHRVNMNAYMMDTKLEREKQEMRLLRHKSLKEVSNIKLKDAGDPIVYGVEYQPKHKLPEFDILGYESYEDENPEDEISYNLQRYNSHRFQVDRARSEYIRHYIKNLEAEGFKVKISEDLIVEVVEKPRSSR